MGLDPATTRHYQVSAINAVGTSDASGSDDATTATTPTNTAPTVANAILDHGDGGHGAQLCVSPTRSPTRTPATR